MPENPRVHKISYHDLAEGVGATSIVMVVMGHPNQAIEKARAIAAEIFDWTPWHFTEIKMKSPMEQNLGDNKDSEWQVTAVAEMKLPRHHHLTLAEVPSALADRPSGHNLGTAGPGYYDRVPR